MMETGLFKLLKLREINLPLQLVPEGVAYLSFFSSPVFPPLAVDAGAVVETAREQTNSSPSFLAGDGGEAGKNGAPGK